MSMRPARIPLGLARAPATPVMRAMESHAEISMNAKPTMADVIRMRRAPTTSKRRPRAHARWDIRAMESRAHSPVKSSSFLQVSTEVALAQMTIEPNAGAETAKVCLGWAIRTPAETILKKWVDICRS